MNMLENRVALVTGGAAGRGRAHSCLWAWSCDTDSRAVPCSSLKI